MTWKYSGIDFTETSSEYEGFVYLITNLKNGKKYIGKKTFWFRQKNKKTGKRELRESDWKSYFGSCQELISDVKVLGKENFLREILYLCKSKKSMTYYEIKEQFNRNVLEYDEYYNTNIGGRYFHKDSIL
jgi:hypothetical protein